jgi:hypothetical protein
MNGGGIGGPAPAAQEQRGINGMGVQPIDQRQALGMGQSGPDRSRIREIDPTTAVRQFNQGGVQTAEIPGWLQRNAGGLEAAGGLLGQMGSQGQEAPAPVDTLSASAVPHNTWSANMAQRRGPGAGAGMQALYQQMMQQRLRGR